MKTEIRSLTGLRGLASLYVALYHYLRFFPADFKSRWLFSIIMHGYLSVDLFFILSAFVLSLSNNFQYGSSRASYRNFMLRRWLRIYPSYFIIVLAGYFLVYFFPARLPNFIVSLSLLSLAFNKPVIFLHLWSLGAEWIIYAIFPLLVILVAKMKSRVRNIFLLGAGIGFYLLSIYLSGQKITSDYSLDVYEGHAALFRCLAGYLFGLIAVDIYQNKSNVFFRNEITLYSVGAFLAILVFFSKADLLIAVLLIPLLVGIAGGSSVITTFLQSKAVYFLGVVSYPLYLLHYILLHRFDVITRVILKLHIPQFALAGYLFSVVMIAAVFTFCIEKPLITYLSGKLIKPRTKPVY